MGEVEKMIGSWDGGGGGSLRIWEQAYWTPLSTGDMHCTSTSTFSITTCQDLLFSHLFWMYSIDSICQEDIEYKKIKILT
jgi:hypothetical protein